MLYKLILVALVFTWPVLSQIYTQPFTAVTRITMLGTAHGQGTNIAPGECWDSLNPQRKIVQLAGYPRKASNGDISWSWSGAKTGTCYAIGPSGAGGGAAVWGSITGVLASQADLNTALGLKAPLVGGLVPTVNLGTGSGSGTNFLRGDGIWAVPAGGGGGGGTWGTITGTLSDQTDLQNALNLKAPLVGGVVPTVNLGSGGASGTTFLRGDNTWAVPAGGGGGSGTVTSVAGDCGITGGPITTAGTLSFARVPHSTSGTTYTIVTSDCGKVVSFSNNAGVAVTLPAPGTGGGFANGWGISLQNRANGTVTVTPTAPALIDGAATLTIPTKQGLEIYASASNYFTMRGMSAATPSGANVMSELNDVDDSALPELRNILSGDGTTWVSRQAETADITNGVFVPERLASGTPSVGFTPISTGPGLPPVWTAPGAGSGTVTSIATATDPCGVTAAPNPITASGTLKLRRLPTQNTGTTYTFTSNDCGRLMSFSNAAGVAVTLPTIDGVGFAVGWFVHIQNRGTTGNVVITPATNTIDGVVGALTLTPGQGVEIAASAANYFTMRGMGTGGGGGALPPFTGSGKFVYTADGVTGIWASITGGLTNCLDYSNPLIPDFIPGCLETRAWDWSGYHNMSTGALRVPEKTFSTLPDATTNTGKEYNVTDCLTSSCTAGAGTIVAKLRSNGATWVCITCGGGGTVDQTANYTWTGYHNTSGGTWRAPEKTFSTLPTASTNTGREFNVTDCLTAACAAGGGSTVAKLRSNGSSWVCMTCASPAVTAPATNRITNFNPGGAATGTTSVPTSGTRLQQVFNPAQRTISNCTVNVAVISAGSFIYFGLYTEAGAAVCRASADTNSVTGIKTVGCTEGSVSVPPGYYYFAWAATDAVVTMTSLGSPSSILSSIYSGGAGKMFATGATSVSAGALPATLGTLTAGSGSFVPPLMSCGE